MTATDRQLTRIEDENGWVFGMKWSMVGIALALCLLATGCGSMFETGPDRYNTVQGPRRAPLMNPGAVAEQPSEQPAPPVRAMPQPMSYFQPQSEPQDAASVFPEDRPIPPQMATAPVIMSDEMAASNPPMLPPSPDAMSQTERQQPVANVNHEISQMEAAFDRSQRDRAALAQAQEEEGWLPNLGLDGWADGDRHALAAPPMMEELRAPQTVDEPVQQELAQEKMVSVPELRMSKDGTQVIRAEPQPLASLEQDMAITPPHSVPMPPMITQEPQPLTPPLTAMPHTVPEQTMAQPVAVPAAPEVRAAPQRLSVSGLVPPTVQHSGSYLPESRYSYRRY